IIHQINLHNKVLSSDLSVQLNVSEDTIRRDLNELAENGKVIKVYGGALSKSFQFPFQEGNVLLGVVFFLRRFCFCHASFETWFESSRFICRFSSTFFFLFNRSYFL